MLKKHFWIFLSLAIMATGCTTAAGPLGLSIFSAVILSLALFAGACDSSSAKSSYRIFISATTTNGYTGDPPGTVEGADGICSSDSNNPDDGTVFKAMIGSDTNDYFRDRSQNWVLEAKSQYTRLDGTIIGTTDSEAKFKLPLENSMSDTTTFVWSGLDNDMLTAKNNCGDWWYSTKSYTGTGGYTNATTSNAWNVYAPTCDSEYSIICVEQEPVAE